MTIRTGNFRFIRYAEIDRFHRMGWTVLRDLGPTHGIWSVLGWRCSCWDR